MILKIVKEIIEEFKNMDMLSDGLNEFFSVDYSIENSNIYLIKKVKNEEIIRKCAVATAFHYTPGAHPRPPAPSLLCGQN